MVFLGLLLWSGIAEARPKPVHHHRQPSQNVTPHRQEHHHRGRHKRPRPLCVVPHRNAVDLLIRTVMGEAGTEPYEGKVAVAAVILNRVRDGGFGGHSVRGVVSSHFKKVWQFEPWGKHCRVLSHFTSRSPGWDISAKAVEEARNGHDPTSGATHFANVKTVLRRKNTAAMRWIGALTHTTIIGRHTFGRSRAGSDDDPVTAPSETPKLEVPSI